MTIRFLALDWKDEAPIKMEKIREEVDLGIWRKIRLFKIIFNSNLFIRPTNDIRQAAALLDWHSDERSRMNINI